MTRLIANSEEVDFVVRNFLAVQALLESYEIAQTKLPAWIAKKLKEKCIDIESMTKAIDSSWEVGIDKQVIWCMPKEFEFIKDKWYISYGIEGLEWDSLVAEELEEGPYVYLYFEFPDRPNPKQKAWKERVLKAASTARASLSQLGYRVLPQSDDEKYLIKRHLGETINLEKIAEDFDGVIANSANLLIKTVEDTKELLIRQ